MEEDNKVERAEGKPKGSIEKTWWVIPPVFLVFVYWPLVLVIDSPTYYFDGPWYGAMLNLFEDIRSLFSFDDVIFPLFMFGFMGVGHIIAIRKKMSLKYKILVPSILGMMGLWVGAYANFIYYIGLGHDS